MLRSIRSLDRRILLLPLLVAVLAAAVYFSSFLPSADWYETFDPAARGLFSGRSPYEQPLYLNPPWAVLPLLPFVVFPPLVAHGLFFVASALALIYLAWRLGATPLATAAVLLSPTAVGGLLSGNLDAFVYLGMLLPPSWGLMVLMIKPQVGVGVALYYAVESWRQSRFAGLLRTFSLVAVAYLVSALIFPIWVERMIGKPENPWNRSLFPYAVPIGLFFLWLAVHRRNAYFALAATPFFAPYLTFYSYLAVQMALLHEDVEKLVRRDVLQIILTVLLWTIMLVFRL
jgi:hypothetical protein